MRKLRFKYIRPGCDRQHYVNEEDILVVLSRLREEIWQRLRAVYFSDCSCGARVLGSVRRGRHEISICALPPRVSLTRGLVKGQTCAEFGAVRGVQWPHLAVRRFILYDVFLHEVGHLQMVNVRARGEYRRFALEKYAQEFADKWRRKLWSEHFDHPDPAHNAPAPSCLAG